MSETTKLTYDVRVVGHIWQGAECVDHITVNGDDLGECARAQGESAQEWQVRRVQLAAYDQLRDFASIDAWNISRIVTWEHFTHNAQRVVDGASIDYTEETRRRVSCVSLMEFDDDAEESWMRATSEPDDYDEEEDDGETYLDREARA